MEYIISGLIISAIVIGYILYKKNIKGGGDDISVGGSLNDKQQDKYQDK